MNLWKRLKKIFLFTKENKKLPHCKNCYNSTTFFENPNKIEKIVDTVVEKTKSLHVHQYTPWFSITETLTDDETIDVFPSNQRIKQFHSETGVKVYHHKHYDLKKVKGKRRKSHTNDLKIKTFSDFVVADDQETYDNFSSNTYSHTKNRSLFYIKTSPFSSLISPNIMRKL